MILQALKQYYDRNADLPRYGFELKEIPYVLVVNLDGRPAALEVTRQEVNGTLRARPILVAQAVKRSVNIAANLLWDKTEYALGVGLKSEPQRVAKCHDAFKQRVLELGDVSDDAVLALRRFLDRPDKAACLQTLGEPWQQLRQEDAFLTFRLQGDVCTISERPTIRNAIEQAIANQQGRPRFCSITGGLGTMARVHPPVKGVKGAHTAGADIVSFNLPAFRSYGKDQGANACVSEATAFAYTTALNHLLARGSRQKLHIGDASVVFWAATDNPFELHFSEFFTDPPDDDPDRNVRAVESLYKAPFSGADHFDDETKFYVLGLAPNAKRLSIRFWIESRVTDMADNVRQHFADTRIAHGPAENDVLTLSRLLVATSAQGKADSISPHLAGDTVQSILTGLPYPHTVLQATMQRIRAEHAITYPRAALIKACINRSVRYANPTIKEELRMSLDPNNTTIGYRLGRLFAVLERIQQQANPGINATIRDRFYGAASNTPVTVFANLMRLKNHHVAKLENVAQRIYFEKLLGEIMAGVHDFPACLSLEDQGRFAIGYYHQAQLFYTRKTN